MPIALDKIAAAIGSGVSAVCATCSRYWEARDAKVPGSRCMSASPCGSPIAGDSFSNYKGPLLGVLDMWCFVCAHRSDYAVTVPGRSTRIGICEKHIDFVKSHRAVGGPDVNHSIRSSQGEYVQKPDVAKKDLFSAIAESEKSFHEEDVRNGVAEDTDASENKV